MKILQRSIIVCNAALLFAYRKMILFMNLIFSSPLNGNKKDSLLNFLHRTSVKEEPMLVIILDIKALNFVNRNKKT